MQSKTLLTVLVAVVAILAIVSGSLWLDLRSARHQIADLEDQLTKVKPPVRPLASGQAPVVILEAPSVPSAVTQPSELRSTSPSAIAVSPPGNIAPPAGPSAAPRIVFVPAPRPERPVGLPTLTSPLAGGSDEERRKEALAQSDRTAAARVSAWRNAINFTPDQLQVLNTITAEELRRETEESLRITSINAPVDAASTARLKVETVNRQYETLTRIADRMEPQLPPEESKKMRNMFDRWLTTNMARARLEEQAALSGR